MRPADKVIAILCSDIHLCEKAPLARSAEEDWFAAMLRPINEVAALATEHDCPIICAGDVFDRWNPSPRLINWAIEHIPVMYSICGQHDLRLHNYEDIEHTAYWTLVQAGNLTDLDYHYPLYIRKGNLMLHSFPWGKEVQPFPQDNGYFNLAVIHSYIWMKEHSYPGAPESARVKEWLHKLRGYDAAVFGDNHKGFKVNSQIFNCGTLMRRKIDEYDYKPQVGLLFESGMIETHYLDTTEDKFIDVDDREQYQALMQNSEEMERFMSGLAELGGAAMDFHEAVKRWISDNTLSPMARRIIIEAMAEEK